MRKLAMDEYYRNIPADQELIRSFEADDKNWMIVDRSHPVHPFIDHDNSTRIYRRKSDADAFIKKQGMLDLNRLYIEEGELKQMVADWAYLGLESVRFYRSDREFDQVSCRDYAGEETGPFKESGRIPSILLKIRQIEGGTHPESLADERESLIADLKEESRKTMVYIVCGEDGEDFSLLDDPMITGKMVGAFTNRKIYENVYGDREGRFVSLREVAEYGLEHDGVIIDPAFHGVQYILDRDKLRKWIVATAPEKKGKK